MKRFNIILGGEKSLTVKADNGKHYALPCLSKKEYRKIEAPKLIGYSSLKLKAIPDETDKKNHSGFIGILGYQDEYEDVLISAITEDKKKYKGIKGYLNVGNNRYVAVEKNNLFLFLIPFLLILISCTVLGLGFFDNPASPDKPWHPVLEEIPDSDDDKNNEVPQIQVAGFSSWHIPAGKTENIPISLKNPEGNPCYFSFEIYLKDTNEVLYTSKMVKPGDTISRITIDKALNSGKYTAVVHINTNELETGSKMNDASFEVKLTVS